MQAKFVENAHKREEPRGANEDTSGCWEVCTHLRAAKALSSCHEAVQTQDQNAEKLLCYGETILPEPRPVVHGQQG